MANVPFLCPTEERPYLATAFNSAQSSPEEYAATMQSLASDYGAMVNAISQGECPL